MLQYGFVTVAPLYDFVILTFPSVSIEIGQKKRNHRETGLMPVSEIIRCATHVLLYFETH